MADEKVCMKSECNAKALPRSNYCAAHALDGSWHQRMQGDHKSTESDRVSGLVDSQSGKRSKER
jgi:hypothetical protein